MSEWLRSLGTFRFDVYGLVRFLKLRKYKAKLYYTDKEVELPVLDQPLDDDPNWNKIEGTFIGLVVNKLPMISKDLVINT